MSVENGVWIMRGLSWDDPYRIRTWQELVNWINEVGFLPLFGNEVRGFSAEEHVSPDYWWTGIRDEDPWEWREIIASSHQVAYGKFFDQKAGFISLEWLPFFVNYRRDGYDFDSRWEDGLANRREKKIMDMLTGRDDDGEMTFPTDQILSTELKKKAGFGKGGEKNFEGTITDLQMKTYLCMRDFKRKRNKKGEEYGWDVAIYAKPEQIFGYKHVTKAYKEDPKESREKIIKQLKKYFPDAGEKTI